MESKLRVRDDDVLRASSDWKGREFERFKRIHSWMIEYPELEIMHVPAIVVNEIMDYPECVEYVVQETKEGRMAPEIHGLEHIDYCHQPRELVEEHIEQCLEWFDKTLDLRPTRFYTPWGGMNPFFTEIAEGYGLTATGVNTSLDVACVAKNLRLGGYGVGAIEGKELFMHWWNRGIRLKRVIMAIKHGSWEAAAKAEDSKEYF